VPNGIGDAHQDGFIVAFIAAFIVAFIAGAAIGNGVKAPGRSEFRIVAC